LARVTADIDRLLLKLRQTEPDMSEPVLNNLQRQLYRDFVRNFQRLQANLNPRPIGLADAPPELRRKFISDGGRFLLQIHPAVNIWERDGARRFVSELRGVDPDVTGTPIITYEAINLMERAYKQGTVYAVVLVAAVSFLVFRRVRETAMALLPLALGLTWTVGLMYVFDLSFTMGNIFGLPLIIGTAAEYGINILLRFIEGRDHGGPLLPRSTVMGVLVAGLTTIVGFGSLMLADHRGIFGLGLLLTLGTLASLIAALVVLPVLLGIHRPRTGPGAPHPAERQVTPAAVG
jgi:predicted RND superfamily exporter protein